MKKTLMAVAVLGAFAGSAMAANVTLYGVVDESVVYTHKKTDGVKSDSVALESGKQAGNRFGLKGTEELGEGWKVGFILENGFSADDGSLSKYGESKSQNRIFGRESVVYVESDTFGRLTAGRAGQLTSGNGSVGIAGSMSPFGTSTYGLSQMYAVMVGGDRIDNSLTYNTPSFAGLKVYAQASLKADNNVTGDEGTHKVDRYYALGATYKNAGLNLAFVVDEYDYGHSTASVDDGYTVTLGGSYDFEVVKAYLGVQYYKDIQATSNTYGLAKSAKIGQFEGFGVTAGVDVPVAGGTFKFGLGYTDAENADDSDKTFKVYAADVGYVYPITKRTNVYGTAGYSQSKRDTGTESKTDTYQAMVGVRHNF